MHSALSTCVHASAAAASWSEQRPPVGGIDNPWRTPASRRVRCSSVIVAFASSRVCRLGMAASMAWSDCTAASYRRPIRIVLQLRLLRPRVAYYPGAFRRSYLPGVLRRSRLPPPPPSRPQWPDVLVRLLGDERRNVEPRPSADVLSGSAAAVFVALTCVIAEPCLLRPLACSIRAASRA